MSKPYPFDFSLFKAFGVELEYMIVDSTTLDVRAIADEALTAQAGKLVSDVRPDGPGGVIEWSNELVLHVLELKTGDPAPTLDGLAPEFQRSVRRANEVLAPMNARLMPGAMHPWMDPAREMRLWPHDYSPVYDAFDRIFSCKGHGWANLQSTHVNLPFASDEEFGRLHAAIRLALPILPALAASSPVADGVVTGLADTRLEVYRSNSRRVPLVAAKVIPEPVYTRADYEGKLLRSLYDAIAPLDPEGVLQHEWLNARGAIARFDRGSIEIRVLDVQECPAADLAVVGAVTALVRAMTEDRWIDQGAQRAWPVEPLHEILLACIRDAERAVIRDADYLRAFGMPASSATAGDLWRHIAETAVPRSMHCRDELESILERGTLSIRLRGALPESPRAADLAGVYGALCGCLAEGRMFLP